MEVTSHKCTRAYVLYSDSNQSRYGSRRRRSAASVGGEGGEVRRPSSGIQAGPGAGGPPGGDFFGRELTLAAWAAPCGRGVGSSQLVLIQEIFRMKLVFKIRPDCAKLCARAPRQKLHALRGCKTLQLRSARHAFGACIANGPYCTMQAHPPESAVVVVKSVSSACFTSSAAPRAPFASALGASGTLSA